MKICVFGLGYVGLSLSTLLSKENDVVAIDVVDSKVKMVNSGISPITDKEIQDALSSKKLRLRATTDPNKVKGYDYAVIATPTNYDPETNSFDTSSVDHVVRLISELSPETAIVIKSTIPIGYTERKYGEGYRNIMFSPEFLREGKALYDNLHPSRIIAGIPSEELKAKAEEFCDLLSKSSEENNVKTIIMSSSEAESVKLFSNTYLAMRVAFFNELDTYAEMNDLDTKRIIEGVCADPRIGNHYNNPSFGYGGYCLPKDTKQIMHNYSDTPNDIITAIVRSNDTRKDHIVDEITKRMPSKGTVGIYRVSMKSGSDNHRESSILDIAKRLMKKGYGIVVFEPSLGTDLEYDIDNDMDSFVARSDVIITNRVDSNIKERAGDKLYSRDVFSRD